MIARQPFDKKKKQAEIVTQKICGKTVLNPKESLTLHNCDQLKSVFDELIKQGITLIVLDLQAVPFIDSKALEMLVIMQKQLKKNRSDLVIIEMNDVCRDIFIATRLISQFRILAKKDLASEK